MNTPTTTTHPRCDGQPIVPDTVHVLSIHARVEEADVAAFVRDALEEIRAHIEAHHADVQGPPFSICRPVSPHTVDVEVGWPVERSPGGGRIASAVEPAVLVRRGDDHTHVGPQGHRTTVGIPDR